LNWQPWQIEPPCKSCKYWHPEFKYFSSGGLEYSDGIVLCRVRESGGDMYSDFSCYKERGKNAG